MEGKLIGKITHYFDKAMVMVVKLDDEIKVGDKIKIKKGEEEFEHTIDSMQVNHEGIESAKAGDEVAIKISQATKEGAEVYKVE